MFYEEKIKDNVLWFRTLPQGKWERASYAQVVASLKAAHDDIGRLLALADKGDAIKLARQVRAMGAHSS
jgi:hypothetical protein